MKDANEAGGGVPLTGGYFWLPRSDGGSTIWGILTCHDLGFDADQSHYDMWPRVVSRLAEIWGRDPRSLRKRLGGCCYGLPRGRVTRPSKQFLIVHGNDSPLPGWEELVVQRFNLRGRRVRALFDEHEQMFRSDRMIIEEVLGLVTVPRKLDSSELGMRSDGP